MLLLSAAMLVSCEKECNHEDIWEKLNNHEDRISKLEILCKQMNTNISSLQTIVEALQKNVYVVSVNKVTEGGVEVGFHYILGWQGRDSVSRS